MRFSVMEWTPERGWQPVGEYGSIGMAEDAARRRGGVVGVVPAESVKGEGCGVCGLDDCECSHSIAVDDIYEGLVMRVAGCCGVVIWQDGFCRCDACDW